MIQIKGMQLNTQRVFVVQIIYYDFIRHTSTFTCAEEFLGHFSKNFRIFYI